MDSGRYTQAETESLVQAVLSDGFCLLPDHFERSKLVLWSETFAPLLERHVQLEGSLQNRGPERYYVTLPFVHPFADPEVFEDEDILAVVKGLVGEDAVMCQLATDTPLFGSDYQDIHRDAPSLFPDWGRETPPFQLAVNFPLVAVQKENGPFEIGRGTHLLSKTEGLALIESGEIDLESILMQLGDVMVRDVRALHRGTPNLTAVPRPMVVIGYSRRWLFRPEVSIRIPRALLPSLSERARHLLRFNPVVESLDEKPETELYQSFAY